MHDSRPHPFDGADDRSRIGVEQRDIAAVVRIMGRKPLLAGVARR
ncbi:MAG: hypothetical protein ACREX7_02750 [Casimicrobiaceae bacterium]